MTLSKKPDCKHPSPGFSNRVLPSCNLSKSPDLVQVLHSEPWPSLATPGLYQALDFLWYFHSFLEPTGPFHSTLNISSQADPAYSSTGSICLVLSLLGLPPNTIRTNSRTRPRFISWVPASLCQPDFILPKSYTTFLPNLVHTSCVLTKLDLITWGTELA